MDSKEVIRKLLDAGWIKARQSGSHVQFKRLGKPGLVTVSHLARDIPLGTLKSIEKQSGLKLR